MPGWWQGWRTTGLVEDNAVPADAQFYRDVIDPGLLRVARQRDVILPLSRLDTHGDRLSMTTPTPTDTTPTTKRAAALQMLNTLAAFRDPSWDAWRVALAALDGAALTDDQAEI